MANIYTDIKEIITTNFQFLKNYGFSDFEEKQLAYEQHFLAKNSFVKIDIWFEAISSSPIWATINGLYIDNLELENPKLKEYSKALNDNYEVLFQTYLKTNDKNYLVKISNRYSKIGKQINKTYLEEVAQIIQRHPEILEGNLEALKYNSEKVSNKHIEIENEERIRKGTITIEFDFLNNGEFSAFSEFTSIEEAKRFIEKQEYKKYRILDSRMNEIKFS